MRIWFNKTFSSIGSVFNKLKQANCSEGVTIIHTHTNPQAVAFLAADECYLEPSHIDGEAYLDWCLTFCQTKQIDVFWPAKYAKLVGRRRDAFEAIGTQVLSVAAPDTLALLEHKAEFYRTLPPEVAPVMACIAVHDEAGFAQAVTELAAHHAVLCVKPSVSVFGLGFRILDTKRDSITHLLKGIEYQIPLAELQSGMQRTTNFAELLVMEHLDGQEWSVDCVAQQGHLLCAIQRKKLIQVGYGQEIDNNAAIQAMVERLTVHFKLNGIFNIQFKAGRNGPCLLEINARPSGGFGMSCLAGVNLAEVFLQSLTKQSIRIPAIQYGLRVIEVNQPVVLQAPVGKPL